MDTVENVRDGQAFTFGSLREVVMDSSGWESYCESPWHCRRRATQSACVSPDVASYGLSVTSEREQQAEN